MNTLLEKEKTKKLNNITLNSNYYNHFQAKALEKFLESGLPNQSFEEYKYCNVQKFYNQDFKLDLQKKQNLNELLSFYPTIEKIITTANSIVYVNGQLVETKIIKEDTINIEYFNNETFEIEKLSKYKNSNAHDPLLQHNIAYTQNPLWLQIGKCSQPIVLLHIETGFENNLSCNATHLEFLKNESYEVMEFFISANLHNSSFSNNNTTMYLSENTSVNHIKYFNLLSQVALVNTTNVFQEKQSNYSSFNFSVAEHLVRNNINISQENTQCHSELIGLYIGKEKGLVDNHTLIEHKVENCTSNELYKGILYDKSTGVFNGKIKVSKEAQKTNAYQSNKNLLMSTEASINTKPQLEIFADDVKCSHGTSTGKVDTNALFYLKSRGISHNNAVQLLLMAYTQEIIDYIKNEQVLELVLNTLKSTGVSQNDSE
jgi:Fe-S cluster assembly protein SufD